MLTYRLVLPSVICLKISGVLSVLPLNVNANINRYDCKNPTAAGILLRFTCYLLLLLKALQLLWSIRQLVSLAKSTSTERRNELRSTIVMASIMICMILVCIFWNIGWWRNKDALVDLLRSLDVKPEKGRRKRRRVMQWEIWETAGLWSSMNKYAQECRKQVWSYCRLVQRDLKVLMPDMTLKDVCAIIVPFYVILTVLLLCMSVWAGVPHYCLAVSMVSADPGCDSRLLLVLLLNTVDCMIVMYMALTFHAGLYMGFFVEAYCISKLQLLVQVAR